MRKRRKVQKKALESNAPTVVLDLTEAAMQQFSTGAVQR